jgi:AraC-like DNA-binding protein
MSKDTQSLLLRLRPSHLAETAEAMGIGSHNIDLAPAIHVRDAQIERIAWMMQTEENDVYPGGRLFADSLASALATRLLSLQFRAAAPACHRGRGLPAMSFRRVIEYIEAHLEKDLTLVELANVAGYSMSHFKSLFKQAAGLPVHRFVLERRIERARMSLLEGRKSVTTIAMETGFAHPSHMARCMRRMLGASPSEIAQRHSKWWRFSKPVVVLGWLSHTSIGANICGLTVIAKPLCSAEEKQILHKHADSLLVVWDQQDRSKQFDIRCSNAIRFNMFVVLPPAPELSGLVQAYWFIQDLAGEHEGRPIRTSPIPSAVLSVNLGRPNAAEDGSLVPRTSILGLRSRARTWRSWSETYFVMAMLTVPGLVRLFPHAGPGCADSLLDLGAITGDAPASFLSSDIDAASESQRIACRLDRWLTTRLVSTKPVRESQQITVAHNVLRWGGSVERAAAAGEMNRRQLHRLFHRHLGIGPKQLADLERDLERLHSSLRGVQTGYGDPLAGFSDQAHQIRSWRRRLGVTPGTYASEVRTPMATYFSSDNNQDGPAFYL